MYRPIHFNAYELVEKEVYKLYGEQSILFLNPQVLKTADILREFFNTSALCNNWHDGGTLHSRGYRNPFSKVGAKYSQHKFGRALDLSFTGISAEEVRKAIIENKEKFPYIYRMERKVSWVHFDMHPGYKNNKGILLFNP